MNWHEDKIKKHKHYKSLGVTSDISVLYPKFTFLILKLFNSAHKEGLKICIFETYRSQERQLHLFNEGKTKLKKNGMHYFGVAVDIVFRNERNHPVWQGDWEKLGSIGRKLGLYWGGDWKSFKDYPHFQFIPATRNDQAKIINGDYPTYENWISNHTEKLISIYETIKDNNYSDESLKSLVNLFNGNEEQSLFEKCE